MPDPHDSILRRHHEVTLDTIQQLVDRARLALKVDRDWADIYTVLVNAGGGERLERFFAEFARANSVEQQAAVLEKWSAWRTIPTEEKSV